MSDTYKFFDNILLRIPSLSFNNFKNYHEYDVISKTHIQEAIYVASPVLFTELQKLLKNEIKDPKEKEKIKFSLYKYISRMITRCTPFGLFAGYTLGQISDKTDIVLSSKIKKHTRLDMYYLCALSQELMRLPAIRNNTRYYPNSSLYVSGKKYRYVEYQYVNSKRIHQISAVDKFPSLDILLKKTEHGAKIDELLTLLTSNEIPISEAKVFIDELIDSQIIISEISPIVTGNDYLDKIIQLLDSYYPDGEIVSIMKSVQEQLKHSGKLQDHFIVLYKSIIENIKQIKIPYEENFLFQVDVTRETSISTLGKEIIEELKSTFLLLNKITPAWKNENLSKFQQAFYERYEGREVSLMEALDPELGIGYPVSTTYIGNNTPLLDNFFLPSQTPTQTYTPNTFQSLLFSKMQEALSKKLTEITITDQDTQSFKENWDDLPPTFYCMFEIVRGKADDILIKLNSLGGSCAANLLARFAYTNERIAQWLKVIANKEQELMSNVILAEIAHLPDSRVGNILSRPHIRNYEILYLAHSDLPQDQVIYVSDLTLSIRQGRLYLRSKKLNKEIVPRLTNAHNYRSNSMPVYHFLCDMQIPNRRGALFFSWGCLKDELTFLPRVRYKNTILSLATWKIKVEMFKPFFPIKEDEVLLEKVKEWRRNYTLPQYVLLPDGDNELFVDWENALSIRALFSVIKKRYAVSFTEFLFEPENAVVRDTAANPYLNQCIVTFYKNNKV